MIESETRVSTFRASEILTTVATNWMHRFPVRYDTMTGEVELDEAKLVMTADSDTLSLSIIAEDDAAMTAAQETVEAHVDRAADDEKFKYHWTVPSAAG